jgi:hypothetical protein
VGVGAAQPTILLLKSYESRWAAAKCGTAAADCPKPSSSRPCNTCPHTLRQRIRVCFCARGRAADSIQQAREGSTHKSGVCIGAGGLYLYGSLQRSERLLVAPLHAPPRRAHLNHASERSALADAM